MTLGSKLFNRFGQFSQILLMRLYAAGTSFALTLLLVRLLGPEEFGAYTFALGWVSIGVLFTTFGFHHFLIRSIPHLLVRRRMGEVTGLIVFGACVVVVMSIATASAVYANAAVFSGTILFQSATAVAAIMLVPRALSLLRMGVLQGLGSPVVAHAPERLVEPTLLFFAVCLFFIAPWPRTAENVLWVSIGVICLSLLVGAGSLRKTLGELATKPVFAEAPTWVAGAVKASLVFAAGTALSATDVVMLGLLSTPEETGVYGVAARFFLLMGLPLNAASVLISQKAALLHAQGDRPGLADMAVGAANRTFLATMALAVPSTAIAMYSDIVFGVGFAAAMTPILLLVWGRVLIVVTGQPGVILANTQFVGHVAIIAIVTVFANVVLNAQLIPLFGANGAALATITSFAAMTLGHLIFSQKLLGFMPFVSFWRAK